MSFSHWADFKFVKENEIVILTIDHEKERDAYQTTPLITCFAYVLLYRTHDKKNKIVLAHALAGEPSLIDHIAKMIKDECEKVTEVAVGIPDTRMSPYDLSFTFLQSAKEKLDKHFAFTDNLKVELCRPLYRIDSHGNYGLRLPRSSAVGTKRPSSPNGEAKKAKPENDSARFIKATKYQPPKDRPVKPAKKAPIELKPIRKK